ncbi:DUF6518 family protein [Streptomyces sp. NPDC059445]|uniref:DUF6518 family protein n=1 Tax=Streptomyces sp. NPDC059445 TaxID=3346832 RepID=UPI0036AFF4D5
MISSRSFVLAPAAALLAGAALGVLTRALETDASAAGRGIYLVLNEAWPWSALAFLAGLAVASRAASAVVAAVSLAAAVAAYYVVHSDTTWSGALSATLAWGAVALVVGPVLGLMGNLARSPGLPGLPFRLVIPALAVVETTARLRAEVSLQGQVGETAWTITRFAAVAVCLALAAHAVVINRRHGSRS